MAISLYRSAFLALFRMASCAGLTGYAQDASATTLVSLCGDEKNERSRTVQVKIDDAQKANLFRDFEKFGRSHGYEYFDYNSAEGRGRTRYPVWALNIGDAHNYIHLRIAAPENDGTYEVVSIHCVDNKSGRAKSDEFLKFVTSYAGVTVVPKSKKKGN